MREEKKQYVGKYHITYTHKENTTRENAFIYIYMYVDDRQMDVSASENHMIE